MPWKLGPSVTDKPYQKLSIAEKRARDLDGVRERAVTCPSCDTQVMPSDLLGHLKERCTGPRDPGPGAKWLTWREALAVGAKRRTLIRWVRRGYVRVQGGRGDRLYFARDLILQLAWRKASHRR